MVRERLAKSVVQQVLIDGGQDYFSLATLAEALVILGDLDGADHVLRRAIQAVDADVGSRSTTYLQLQRLKAGLRKAQDPDWEDLGRWVATNLAELFRTNDHKEGVKSFLEKRPPNYTGT